MMTEMTFIALVAVRPFQVRIAPSRLFSQGISHASSTLACTALQMLDLVRDSYEYICLSKMIDFKAH